MNYLSSQLAVSDRSIPTALAVVIALMTPELLPAVGGGLSFGI